MKVGVSAVQFKDYKTNSTKMCSDKNLSWEENGTSILKFVGLTFSHDLYEWNGESN